MNFNYIFNIPLVHIENLVIKEYPSHIEQLAIVQEECSELIQAVSKYIRWLETNREDSSAYDSIRVILLHG